MNSKLFLTTILFILLTATLSSADSKQDRISMNVPVSVIKRAVDKSLPLDFNIDSDTLLGSIFIEKIENPQPRPKRSILITPKLIIRESTAKPSIS